MAMIGRKEPATPSAVRKEPTTRGGERPRPQPAAAGGSDNGRFGKIRGNINDVLSELRKVTWPTREETRNLTVVVIGLSVVLGLLLGGFDLILGQLYRLVNP